MAYTSELEKLERRYGENPEGRFFAPLADAYRKAGQVDHALLVVRAGLEKHPSYVSAHIVLARCLLDKGDDVAAAESFLKVLQLDGENIIALQALAEITLRAGQTFEAREWLEKLLAVDPMNTEAKAELDRLGGQIAKATTAPMMPALPSAEIEQIPAAMPGAGWLDAQAPPTALELEAPVGAEPLEAVAESDEGEEPEVPDEFVAPPPLDWMAVAREIGGEGLAPPETAAAPARPDFLADLPLIIPDSVAMPAAPPAPMAALEPPFTGPATLEPPFIEPPTLEPALTEPAALEPPLTEPPVSGGWAETPPLEPATPPPQPLLTSTMAELFLQQGHSEEAVEIYRRLVAARPGDAALGARLEELEAASGAPLPAASGYRAAELGVISVGEWLRQIAARAGPVAALAPGSAEQTWAAGSPPSRL